MQDYQFYHVSQLNKSGLFQFTSQHTTEMPMIYTLSDHHISIWVPNKTWSTLNGQKAPYIFNSSTNTAIHENPKIAGLELIMVGGSLRPPPLLWSGLVWSGLVHPWLEFRNGRSQVLLLSFTKSQFTYKSKMIATPFFAR